MSSPNGGPAYTARQLAEIHRVAQEKLGLTAGLVAYEAVSSMNVLDPEQTQWYERIVLVTSAIRSLSRVLAARYYNLARAIETEYTYSDVGGIQRTTVPRSVLYAEMAEVLNEVINLTRPEAPEEESTAGSAYADADYGISREERLDDLDDIIADAFTELLPEEDSDEWLGEVEVEDWDWGEDEDDEDEFFDELEEEVAQEVEKLVDKAERLAKKEDPKLLEVIQNLQESTADSVAGIADASAMAPGRNVIDAAGTRDKRVQRWMRVTGANPCGFCSMLAARGAVYRSKRTASRRSATGGRYHDNCHCTEQAIWVDNPWYSERDVYFIRNWKTVTEGHSKTMPSKGKGSPALLAWRRWLAAQYKAGKVPNQVAQGERP